MSQVAIPSNTRTKIVIYSDVNKDFTLDSNDIYITNITAVNVKIKNILETEIGTRPKEPTFGSNLPRLLFEPIDDQTAWLIETAIFDALITWLGTIIQLDLKNCQVIADIPNQTYFATISYIIIQNQIKGQLNIRFARDSQTTRS